MARGNLIDFSIHTDKNYAPNWHHELIAEKLEAVEKGDIKRLMLFLPPRHGKSQLATINFPAWYLGRNPENEIITASYSGDLATKFGYKAKELVQSRAYQDVFTTRLKSDAKAKGYWLTQEGGGYMAVGVGGATTGSGANVFIIDDPVKNREEADSETIREKVWDWYTSVARTRLEKGGAVILIMTRWHLDDLGGRLLEKMTEGREKWEIVDLPAIAEKNEPQRNTGDPLWPEKYDLEDLKDIQDTLGVMDWNALYQQHPIALERQEFKKEYFRYFNEEDLEGKVLDYTMTVDLAISEKESADDTVILTVAKEREKPNWYIVNIIHGHLDPLATIDAIFAEYEKYRHQRIGIESVAYQKALLYFIDEEMKKRQVYLPIQEIKSMQKKEMRIRGLIPMFRTGVIYHRKSYLALESQLLNFPQATHDDQPDALAMQLELVSPTKRAKPKLKSKQAINYLTGKRI
jgi:predicted phage terminase large subunit-like protein